MTTTKDQAKTFALAASTDSLATPGTFNMSALVGAFAGITFAILHLAEVIESKEAEQE